MWKCLSCKKENADTIKKCQCGFDNTRNYAEHFSITALTEEETDWWQKNQCMKTQIKAWYDWADTVRPVLESMSEMEANFFLNQMRNSYEEALRKTKNQVVAEARRLYQEGEKWYEGNSNREVNYEQAYKFYKQAAALGNADAINALGICCLRGHGVKRDDKEALVQFEKSANRGNKYAMHNVGWMNQVGRGTNKNLSEAFAWYKKSAEAGYAKAQRKLGDLYYGKADIKEVKEAGKSYICMAANWYEKAAEGGDVEAQRNMGHFYRQGEGVAMDKLKGFRWYEKAARQDDPIAQKALAEMYEYGEGIKKDPDLAIYWRKRALQD